ncbi:MAG: RNA polymerase sigma factor [Sandaracinaceae bacterium]
MIDERQDRREQERRLVLAALDGDGESIRRLADLLQPVIRRRVYRRLSVGGRQYLDQVEDLVQEVWVTLTRRDGKVLRDFDPAKGGLKNWVGRVAETTVWNFLQSEGAIKRGGHAAPAGAEALDLAASGDAPPDRRAESAELLTRLAEHLDAVLPARGLLVFRYTFTDRLTPAEAAEVLGVNLQVVYNWQHRIRSEARAFLAKEGIEPPR